MTSVFVETTLCSVILETTMLVRSIDTLHRMGYVDHYSLSGHTIINKRTGKASLSRELVVDNIIFCEEEGCEGFKIFALTDPIDQSKGILTILVPTPPDKLRSHCEI